MTIDRRLIVAAAGPAVALAAWVAGGAAVLLATLGPDRAAALRAAWAPVLATHGMVLFAWWLVAAVLAAWLGHRLYRRHVVAPAMLLDATRILVENPDAPDVPPHGAPMVRALAHEINNLAEHRRTLNANMAQLVDQASRSVAEQRDQLAALMTELDHAVVVCNLEGRILLYNSRARALCARLSPAPVGGAAGATSGGADRIGLGRPITGVVDPAAITHALDTVRGRLARGVDPSAAVAQVVTTTEAGHLLQVRLAPVRSADAGGGDRADSPADENAGLTGYVLLLDDITVDQHVHLQRDQALLQMTENGRACAATMQAALDMLDLPDLEPADRDRFLAVVRDEVTRMRDRLAAIADSSVLDVAARWPLQDMLGSDLIAAIVQHLGRVTGTPITTLPGDGDLWLRIDSFSLIKAFETLAQRLRSLTHDPVLWIRLSRNVTRAHLDLGWTPRSDAAPIAPQALTAMQLDPIQSTGAGGQLSVRDVVERHGGEMWIERGRGESQPFFRILLPLAAVEVDGPALATGSRPEFYDFDLFAARPDSVGDDRPLADLSFTVFDCETTGLDPAGGDEIIQIGAVRVVNGRVLRGDTMDQLIDPCRSIPEAGIPIHHIHPEMVRGKPTIAQVLPVFHRFAADSVLVGHNVAFDMRFLRLKEAATGLRFDHPVLDTLLLSSIVHPAEDHHGLEAIAERLGIAIGGRHTALGDALATADVFVRLLPLLAKQGIVTLGQARSASSRSQFARLKY